MIVVYKKLSDSFLRFFHSEKSSGILLIGCTIISLSITNSLYGDRYLEFWETPLSGLSLSLWINDALMAAFFLLIGLELERELYSGELSNFRNALLPLFAALGGVIAPAIIHFSLNAGLPTQSGIGIPMATDIAFAIGALALLGNKIPPGLKVLVVAFAVIDDLFAIVVIALFYTSEISGAYLASALGVWGLLIVLNRNFRVMALAPYLLGGGLMWFFMLKSGVHATITGVMLAFAIPYSAKDEDCHSPSHKLEKFLHLPVAFLILPVFALANTAVPISAQWTQSLATNNSLGIIVGLVLGKPLGITLFCFVAVISGICRLPLMLGWKQIFGAGMLGGIGFTMSIFITNLAFAGNTQMMDASKMAILVGSLTAGSLGLLWLGLLGKSEPQKAF